jgi:hypothetical protein
MALHIVGSYQTINYFKTSKYFKTNLGLVATVEKNGSRVYNDKDRFSFFYNNQYKTTIYAQGNVGDIKFYGDHYIKDDTFAVYYGETFEEFLFKLDLDIIKGKGTDFYLGHILKKVEIEYEERVKNEELKKLEEKPVGNADMITKNPGNVTYADLKAYLEQKRSERYKNI